MIDRKLEINVTIGTKVVIHVDDYEKKERIYSGLSGELIDEVNDGFVILVNNKEYLERISENLRNVYKQIVIISQENVSFFPVFERREPSKNNEEKVVRMEMYV